MSSDIDFIHQHQQIVQAQKEEDLENAPEPSRARGVYSIAVAAELVGVGEQTLRLYERKGLLEPSRTAGGTRRYSEDDLSILRRVVELLDAGVNLVGARHVLALETTNRLLRAQLEESVQQAVDGDRFAGR